MEINYASLCALIKDSGRWIILMGLLFIPPSPFLVPGSWHSFLDPSWAGKVPSCEAWHVAGEPFPNGGFWVTQPLGGMGSQGHCSSQRVRWCWCERLQQGKDVLWTQMWLKCPPEFPLWSCWSRWVPWLSILWILARRQPHPSYCIWEKWRQQCTWLCPHTLIWHTDRLCTWDHKNTHTHTQCFYSHQHWFYFCQDLLVLI